jgi:hypothetical protein
MHRADKITDYNREEITERHLPSGKPELRLKERGGHQLKQED